MLYTQRQRSPSRHGLCLITKLTLERSRNFLQRGLVHLRIVTRVMFYLTSLRFARPLVNRIGTRLVVRREMMKKKPVAKNARGPAEQTHGPAGASHRLENRGDPGHHREGDPCGGVRVRRAPRHLRSQPHRGLDGDETGRRTGFLPEASRQADAAANWETETLAKRPHPPSIGNRKRRP